MSECHRLTTVTVWEADQVQVKDVTLHVLKVIPTTQPKSERCVGLAHPAQEDPIFSLKLPFSSSFQRAIRPSLLHENGMVPGGLRGAETEFHPFLVVQVDSVFGTRSTFDSLRTVRPQSRAPWSRVAACLKIGDPFPNDACKRITWELKMQILWPLFQGTSPIGCAQGSAFPPCTIRFITLVTCLKESQGAATLIYRPSFQHPG